MKEFFSLLWARFDARRKGIVSPKPLFDQEKIEELLRTSPVPGVTMMALLWVLGSTLLIVSMRQHRDISDWMVGQKAPQNIHARADFTFTDTEATALAKEEAAAEAPEYFVIDQKRSEEIIKRFDEFFSACSTRGEDIRNRRTFHAVSDSPAYQLAEKITPQLLDEINKAHFNGNDYLNFRDYRSRLLSRGIISKQDKNSRVSGRQIRIADASGRVNLDPRTVSMISDPEQAAMALAAKLFPEENGRSRTLGEVFLQLIGEEGTLIQDTARTAAARQTAMAQIPPIRKSRSTGDLLIRKGDIFTNSMRDMMEAERNALPKDFGMNIFYYNMIWCLIMLGTAAFFLSRVYPEILRDARKICIAGLVMSIALLINYGSLHFFDFLLRDGKIVDRMFVCNAVPAALPAVVLAALLNYRTAATATLPVIAITAMMISPERAFEYGMRWFAVAAICGLAVRHISNYRAYFIRILFISFILTLLVTLDLTLPNCESLHEVMNAIVITFTTAFACAVLAMVIIFAMELIFNIDTDMALMVLADNNHPLLERLKREAPGTMFHSMSVATLAEDAAKAIGANPLRAKVAGLFHDIGKLTMPQYFTENNRDSSSEHLKLNPQMSSIIIRDHVKEGLILARQYRLFRWVRGAIKTHHGDDLVYYFYAKAKSSENDNEHLNVVEEQFRYNGNPPRAKELTIVSLADACEAASRQLDKPTPQKIQSLVEDIFVHRFKGGQLRNSELTLAEFETVKMSIIKTLVSINHGRIAYAPEEMNAKPALSVAESASAGPGQR